MVYSSADDGQQVGSIYTTARIDYSQFDRDLRALANRAKTIKIPVTLEARRSAESAGSSDCCDKMVRAIASLERSLGPSQGSKEKDCCDQLLGSIAQLTSAENRLGGILTGKLDQLIKSVDASAKAAQGGLIKSIRQGFGESIGKRISGGVQSSLKKGFNLDARNIGKGAADRITQPVKFFITENPELGKAVGRSADRIGAQLEKAGFQLGDGIIAALEASEGGVKARINALIKGAVKEGDKAAAIAFAKAEAKKARADIGSALTRSQDLAKIFQGVGGKLESRRVRAIDDRAIPLVRQRAADILGQKRAKNSANVVTDDTSELIIATGGYAGARGLSGARLAKEIGRSAPPDAQVIWTKNTDTDIPKESMGKASSKLLALLTSLGKPNLRGYSQDAVEIAAQGLAAVERNPEINIKIVGESGGGFAAEEAAKILKMLGVKNVEYLGVGTPDFVGGFRDAPGRKIISPDEVLGAEAHGLYAKLGLVNKTPEQKILGVEGHPFENYNNAGIAELRNFISEKPKPFSREEIDQTKGAAKQFSALKRSGKSDREMEVIAKQAFANLQLVRQQVEIASGETKDELQAIANQFQAVYVEFAPENRDFGTTRSYIEQGNKLLDRIRQNPGVEAGATAAQAMNDLLAIQAEFDQKYSKTVGTQREKYLQISAEIQRLISGFSNRSLSSKQPEPVEPGTARLTARQKREQTREILQTFNRKKELIPLAEQLGLGDRAALGQLDKKELIRQISEASIKKVYPAVLQASRDKSQRMLARQESLSNAANAVGGAAGAIVQTGQNTLGPLLQITGKIYHRLEAIEQGFFEAAPFGGLMGAAKAPLRNVALFNAAMHVPGIGAAGEALTGAAEGMLSLPAHGMADAALSALSANIIEPLANIPLLGGKLAPLLEGGAQAMLTGGADAAAGLGAGVLTPLLGGEVLNKGLDAALPKTEDNRLLAAKAGRLFQQSADKTALFIERTSAQVNALRAAADKAQKLLPGQRRVGNSFASTVQNLLPGVSQAIEAEILKLPESDRMGTKQGQQLAQLKGQITQIRAKVESYRQLESSDIIDVDFTEIQRAFAELPSAESVLDRQVQILNDAIKTVGESFKMQVDSAKTLGADSPAAQEIARQVLAQTESARAEIDKALAALGDRVPQQTRKIARTARQRITKSSKAAGEIYDSSKDIGANAVAGVVDQIGSSVGNLEKAGSLIAKTLTQSTKDDLGIRSPSRVFQDIGENIIKGLEKGLGAGKGILSKLFDATGGNDAIDSFKDLALSAAGLVGGGVILQNLAQGAIAYLGVATNAALQTEQLENSISALSDSSAEGSRNLAFLRNTADDLGLSLESLGGGYKNILASANDTALEGQVNNIFGAVVQAGAVRQTTNEQQQRALLAVGQSISKEKIQAEELRGQLSEALPGATQIFQRSLSVTGAELNKMLESGSVLAEDTLPKFAQQLKAETSLGLADAADSTLASMNRLENAKFNLAAKVGDVALGPFGLGIKAQTAALNLLGKAVEYLIPTAVGLAVVLAGPLTKAFAPVLAKLGLTAIATKVAGLGFLGMSKQILSTAIPALGKFALQFAVVQAALDVFSVFANGFKSDSETIQKAAESTAQTLKGLAEAQGRLKPGNSALVSGNQLANQIAGGIARSGEGERSYLEGTFLDKIFTGGAELSGRVFGFGEGFGTAWVRGVEAGIQRSLGLSTAKEAIASQLTLQVNSVTQGSNDVLGKIYQNFSVGGAARGELAKFVAIEKQLADAQARRRALSPQQADQRLEADRKINELLKERERIGNEAGLFADQAAIARQIEAEKSVLAELKSKRDLGQLDKQQLGLLDQTESAIKRLQRAQTLYNNALGETLDATRLLVREVRELAAVTADRQQLQSAQADQARATLAQRSVGLRQEQRDALNRGLEEGISQSALELNRQLADQWRSVLSNPEITRALDIVGFGGQSPEQVGLERLKLAAETKTTEGSAERQALESAISAMEQTQSLSGEASSLARTIAEARSEAIDRYRDLARGISDFYLEATRAARDTLLDLEGIQNQIALTQAKTKIKEALLGFQDSFLTDVVSGLTDLFDLLNQPFEEALNAQREINQLIEQNRDRTRQYTDFRRQLAGVNPDPSALGGGAASQGGGGAAEKVVQEALSRAGQEFAPGVLAQCANFVRDVLAKAGVDIGITGSPLDGLETGSALASSFFGSDIGEIIRDKSQIRPGDLVAFGGTYDGYSRDTITHVGIATGDGQMIDRSTFRRPVSHRSLDTFEGPDSGFLYAVRPYAYGVSPGQSGGAIAQAPTQTASGTPSAPDLFSGGGNSLIARIIGISEGNRRADGSFTDAYYGHTDPGNQKFNIGSFSYQGADAASLSPAQADAVWMSRLEPIYRVAQRKLAEHGISEVSAMGATLIANITDLYTQAPLAVTGEGGLLARIGDIVRAGGSQEAIAQARVESFRNPATGALDTNFASEQALRNDQLRRIGALEGAISATGIGRGAIASPSGAGGGPIDTSGSEELLTASLQRNERVLQENIQAINQRAAAMQESQRLEAAIAIDDRSYQLEQKKREQEDLKRQQEREERALQIANLPAGAREIRQQYEDIRSQFEDREREAKLMQERLERTVDQAQVAVERIRAAVAAGASEELLTLIPGFEQVGAAAAANLAEVDGQLARSAALRLQTLERFAAESVMAARQSNESALANISGLGDRYGLSDPFARFQNQLQEIRQTYTDTERSLIPLIEQNKALVDVEGLSAEQKTYLQRTIDELTAAQSRLSDERERAIAIAREQFVLEQRGVLLGFQQQATQSRAALVNAQADQLERNFDPFSAASLRRQAAALEQQSQYQQGLYEIEQQAQAMRVAGVSDGEIADFAANARAELEQLNMIKLDQINQQFASLGETLRTDLSGSLRESIVGFKEVLFSSENLGRGLLEWGRNLLVGLGDRVLTQGLGVIADKANRGLFGEGGPLASLSDSFNNTDTEGVSNFFAGQGFNPAQQGVESLVGIGPMQSPASLGPLQALGVATNSFSSATTQAGQEILAAAQRFNQSLGGLPVANNIMPTNGRLGFASQALPLLGSVGALPTFDPAGEMAIASDKFKLNLFDGAVEASDVLADAGSLTSDNVVGGLARGLPSLAGAVGGLFSGGSAGSGLGSFLGNIGSLFGGLFATGGTIGQGRGRRDDQLILAQRGEGIVSHRGMDLIGPSGLAALNRGYVPMMATGGSIGLSVPPRAGSNALAHSGTPSRRRGESFKFEYVSIGEQRYVTVEQLEQMQGQLNSAPAQGAEMALTAMRRSPSVRSSLHI